jgi:hypothetical protein
MSAAGFVVVSPLAGGATPKKTHSARLGAVSQVAYSKAGADETSLKIRSLVVDGRMADSTTGDKHQVTERSFVVRRALRINDSLPSDGAGENGEKRESQHWVWQRGPWLLVDSTTGHVTALKLPNYDPGVSPVAWFRDYAAYCGVTASGKSLYAMVAQIGARRAVLSKKLSSYDIENHSTPACGLPEWQREPLKVTFHPAGREAVDFDLVGGSAVLVEDDDSESDPKP